MPVITVHVIITGRVQGVGYRAWTAASARKLELRGWVRNLTDGSVEALFSGPKERVEAMLEACQEGPPSAKVEKIQHDKTNIHPESLFKTLPTSDLPENKY